MATFSTRQACTDWMRSTGTAGYIVKVCEGTYTVHAWGA